MKKIGYLTAAVATGLALSSCKDAAEVVEEAGDAA